MIGSKSPHSDPIKRRAARWFARARSGVMAPVERRALDAWLAADAAHSEAYIQVSGAWDAVARLRDDPEIMAMRDLALARYPADGARVRSQHRLMAACIAAGVICTGLLALAASTLQQPATQVFKTGIGQTASISLIDGSRLTLDTDTTVRTRMTGRKRLVYLDSGRAFFKVAKDHSRPFIVEAEGKQVTATGTAFQVKSEGPLFEVLLVEGGVRVSARAERTSSGGARAFSTDLQAGTRLSSVGSGNWTLTHEDGRELAWMKGELVFDNKPLGEIVVEMNRYSRRKIRIDDPAIAARPVYGAFMAGDVDQFVRALVDYHIVKIKSQNGDAVVLAGP